MTKPIIEADPIFAEAAKAREDAIKARARAKHGAAVVDVATRALADAHNTAAEHHIAAQSAEKAALEYAEKARVALEKQLGLSAHEPEPEPEAPKAKATP